MTIEQLEECIDGYKVLRHQFQCFLNVYSEEEALKFSELGAYVRAAGGQPDPLSGREQYGTPTWEVFLAGLMDPVILDRDGEEIDITSDFLLQHFRKRDGYEAQLDRILA